MRILNSLQTAIYLIGALLMAVGAGTSMLAWRPAPYVFAVGAVCFVSMQVLQRYDGTSIVIRRLRRMMLISDFFFLLSAVLMIAHANNFLGLDYINYIEYVYNKWVITLLIAAILQLYSTHRISKELEKEAKKL